MSPFSCFNIRLVFPMFAFVLCLAPKEGPSVSLAFPSPGIGPSVLLFPAVGDRLLYPVPNRRPHRPPRRRNPRTPSQGSQSSQGSQGSQRPPLTPGGQLPLQVFRLQGKSHP
uniref:Uncharacterized protein n=1 Tax=Rhipicephalus appendiculatus TaxID=34631 RepID=A0A131YHD8_RHIAP